MGSSILITIVTKRTIDNYVFGIFLHSKINLGPPMVLLIVKYFFLKERGLMLSVSLFLLIRGESAASFRITTIGEKSIFSGSDNSITGPPFIKFMYSSSVASAPLAFAPLSSGNSNTDQANEISAEY